MEKYFKRKSVAQISPSTTTNISEGSSSKKGRVDSIEYIKDNLPSDPGLRPRIWDYHPNVRDEVRRAYLLKGPCQPRKHIFPTTMFSGFPRRFGSDWFDENPTWLEYSISKDAAYCLCCYLFRTEHGEQGGGDAFISEGFRNWKKKCRLKVHVGNNESAHNDAVTLCNSLLKHEQDIEKLFTNHTSEDEKKYKIRLMATIRCIQFLLRQGLPFRGHDESEESDNRGNFLELLTWLCEMNEEIKSVALTNAPDNWKLVSPKIQKDIVSAIASETLKVIMNDIGDKLFSILIDESKDISCKEQMAIVLRYVDNGNVIERFVGIEHVSSTTAIALKEAIDRFFSRHGLSLKQLRGQGYDGAANMQGKYNGLKALILKENQCAYFVHCFAHQLQLAIIAVAKKHEDIAVVFTLVNKLVSTVGSSPQRHDRIRETNAAVVADAIENNEVATGKGLNQETCIKRAADTRWGSNYNTLISLITMFTSVVDLLVGILDSVASKADQKSDAKITLRAIRTFNFCFGVHLMKTILGYTNELSQALQRKDQDIVNAMNLVRICKERIQAMRDNGWESLLDDVSTFCRKHDIEVPNMEDAYLLDGRPRRNVNVKTNLYYYRVELFYEVIDLQLGELNSRFNETNTELLLCIACLNPSHSFRAFDVDQLVRLAQLYPQDFSDVELVILKDQLETYIMDVKSDSEFKSLQGINDLAQLMVETQKDQVYPLVYLLLTLALILPVATASVERVFSAMGIVKAPLRNRMNDQWMSDSMLVYVEHQIAKGISIEVIMRRFRNMANRRGTLNV